MDKTALEIVVGFSAWNRHVSAARLVGVATSAS